MENTTSSGGNGIKPQALVVEALEGYSVLVQEVYLEAEEGEHWEGVPDWDEYLDEYIKADRQETAADHGVDVPDIPER